MISHLLRWLGLESSPPRRPSSSAPRGPRPRSATAHLFEKKPAKPASGAAKANDDFNPYIYRSTDYGKTWTLFPAGLRDHWFGKRTEPFG